MENKDLTLGQKRVGYNFNPSGDDAVSTIKKKYADLIDELEGMRTNEAGESFNSEKQRTISRAQTAAEDACMLSVKAMFQ